MLEEIQLLVFCDSPMRISTREIDAFLIDAQVGPKWLFYINRYNQSDRGASYGDGVQDMVGLVYRE